MRDPNRIYPFLMEIATLWEQHPDLRFCQLITILESNARKEYTCDPFYLEDNKIIEIIKKGI